VSPARCRSQLLFGPELVIITRGQQSLARALSLTLVDTLHLARLLEELLELGI
jgi:hypothetical protein